MESVSIIEKEDYKIIRGKDGKFLPGTRPPNTINTTDKAHEYHQKRREKAQLVALQAVNNVSNQANIIIPNNIEPEYVGWYAINEDVATGLFSTDNVRNKVEAAKFLGHNTGMIDKSDTEQPGDISISSDLRDLIRDIADIVRG